MRKAGLVAGVTMLGMVLVTADAEAVPSFTRQTGMTCNQCHVSFGAPVPNFTFTGKKFRINGYRMPFVAEKIEAGQPGAINGKRMAIPLAPYLSLRYQSVFASQSKSPGADEASPISSNPTSRLSLFPAGALADYIGLWVEFYLTPDGSTTGEWTQGLFSFDEYDLRFVHVAENTTLGFSFSNQSIKEIAGFGPWPIYLTSHLTRGGFAGWSHPNRGNFYLYGWFNDRVLGVIGASPGEDNLDWDENNFQAQLAIAPLNSVDNELWVTVMTQFGDDGIPIVTRTVPSRDGNLTWRYLDAVSGLSATRPAGAGPYLASDIGDYFRSVSQVRYGFLDKNKHSVEVAPHLSINTEDYADGAEVTENTAGIAVRYIYDRTWGLDFVTETHLSYDFTDRSGVEHEIDTKPSWNVLGSFRPAMNFILRAQLGQSQRNSLNADAETGWRWNIGADYMF